MEVLQTILIVLFFLCCAVLIFLVMLQSGKGGGLSLVGGGGNAMQASRLDPIAKATWYAGIAFFILAILAAISFADIGPGNLESPAQLEGDTTNQTTPEGEGTPAETGPATNPAEGNTTPENATGENQNP